MSVALTLVSGTQKPAKAGGRQLAGIAVCRDRDQLVYGATCTWQLSSTDVSIDCQRPVTNLADPVTRRLRVPSRQGRQLHGDSTIGAAQPEPR
jgi:hypothetical protein